MWSTSKTPLRPFVGVKPSVLFAIRKFAKYKERIQSYLPPMQQFPKRLPLYSTNTLLTVLDKGTLVLDEHHSTPLEVHCYSCFSFDERQVWQILHWHYQNISTTRQPNATKQANLKEKGKHKQPLPPSSYF